METEKQSCEPPWPQTDEQVLVLEVLKQNQSVRRIGEADHREEPCVGSQKPLEIRRFELVSWEFQIFAKVLLPKSVRSHLEICSDCVHCSRVQNDIEPRIDHRQE